MSRAKIRNEIRKITLDVLGLISNPSTGIHLLNSHLLTMDEDLNSDYFDFQLEKLSKKSKIIPFEEAVDLIKSKTISKHSLIAFSYDDGFLECHSHIAPVLEKHNGYGCFFINPNFINGDEEYISSFLKNKVHLPSYKRPMNWSQIKDLHDRGHIIGAHTMDHVRLSDINNIDEIEYQIGSCKNIINTNIDSNCDYFAFTYGYPERDFNINAVEIAEKYYSNIFSAANWRNYFSYDGRILNRRHCEPYWPARHINHFLSYKISY